MLCMSSRLCSSAVFALAVSLAGGASFVAAEQTPATQGDDPALHAFTDALGKYLALRKGVSAELPPLTVTDKPAEIIRASDALARGIERSRRDARQGEFFTESVAKVLRERAKRVAATGVLDDILTPEADERPDASAIRVHARYPVASVLPTMPPSLLAVLPPLPSGLEYRVVGTTLILRDVEAAMILDFLPNAFR